MGILKRAIAKDASVVATAVDATDIVAEIEKIHQTSAVVTAALGRLSIAASMMGYDLKNENDTVTLRVKGGGIVKPGGRCKGRRRSASGGTAAECQGKTRRWRCRGYRRYAVCGKRFGAERALCGHCAAGVR